MFGVTFLLVAGAALACANLRAPPYVQSREAFTYVRTSLAESLRPNAGGIENPAKRKHHSFGILAGVFGGLVMANKTAPNYNPLLVVDEYVPYAWRNYNEIALRAQALMNEASAKTLLIEDLIDNLCDTQSPAQCNLLIEQRVLSNSYIYKLPAELLLLLGAASNTIRRLAPVTDSVTTGRTEIPYLINNVPKLESRTFVTELENAYKKMRQLHFRRFFGFGFGSNSNNNNNINILPKIRDGSNNNNNNNNNNIHFRSGSSNNNNNNIHLRGGDNNNNNNNNIHFRGGDDNNNNNNNILHDSYII